MIFDASYRAGTAVAETGDAPATTVGALVTFLIFAYDGGIILNLMPCVLPVLSIKVLGFIGQAREGRRRAMAHAMTFAGGVVVSIADSFAADEIGQRLTLYHLRRPYRLE